MLNRNVEEREDIVMNGLIKWLIIGALGLYVLSPVDLAPGPIDDAIMVLIYFVAARKKRLAATSWRGAGCISRLSSPLTWRWTTTATMSFRQGAAAP